MPAQSDLAPSLSSHAHQGDICDPKRADHESTAPAAGNLTLRSVCTSVAYAPRSCAGAAEARVSRPAAAPPALKRDQEFGAESPSPRHRARSEQAEMPSRRTLA